MNQAQNIQSAESLLPNNPLPERTPEVSPQKIKSKRNLYILGIMGGISILLLISATFLYFYSRRQNELLGSTPTPIPTSSEVTNETEPTEEALVSPTVGKTYPKVTVQDRNFNTAQALGPESDDEEFQINGVYYVQYQGKDAIYIHFQNSNGLFPQLYYLEGEDIQSISNFDTQSELSRKVLVFRGKQPYDDPSLADFSIDPKRENLYFGLVSHSATNLDSYPDTSNVFKYNFSSMTTDIVIQKKLFVEDFLDFSGAFYVKEAVSPTHVVLYITPCYACGGGERQSFVLNTTTSGYLKLASEIGAIEYNQSDNSITYKKNNIVRQQDDCIEGYCPIFELSDETFSSELP